MEKVIKDKNVEISMSSNPNGKEKIQAKVFPFTKEGDKVVIDQFAPTELVKNLQEENVSFVHEGVLYSFVYYKSSEKNQKKIEKVTKALKNVPVSKEGVYKIELYVDGFNVEVKHLVADVEVVMNPKWSAKSKTDKKADVEVTIVSNTTNETAFQKGRALAQAKMLTMRLVEMPSNYLTPHKFFVEAQEIVENLKSQGKNVSIEAIVGNNLRVGKYGALYGVSKGSTEDAHLITLTYKGADENEKPLVLVGKGLTFDSGGISLKPSKGMGRMKGDMAGAATALSTFLYAASLGLKQNIVAILACAENMPDANAVKPGDVLTAYNGKTIEVEDTDAEGRLVLADALCHAQKFNGHTTIDFATLTGACITALGHIHTGVFSEDEDLLEKLTQLGKVSGDTVWALPMGEEYNYLLKSDVADMSNLCIGQGAGATNGAVFLKEFAPEKGWVHMDIAGTSEVSEATGRPIPLMSDFVDSLSN